MAKDITAKAIITGRIEAEASLGQTVIQYIGEANPYSIMVAHMRTAIKTLYGILFFIGWAIVGWIQEVA